MVTDAVRSQVASRWQDSFNRLNRNAPGISGLMEYSDVNIGFTIGSVSSRLIKFFRRGPHALRFYIPEISG